MTTTICDYKALPTAIPVVIPIEKRKGMGPAILTHINRKGNGVFLATEVALTPPELRNKAEGDVLSEFHLKLQDPQEKGKTFYVTASRVRPRQRDFALAALFLTVLGLVR